VNNPFKPVQHARLEWHGDTPFAPGFGDHYFSPGQGPAESEAVFIQGNDLTARFSALPEHAVFVIGETGFGTGLNLLLAADCFHQYAPATARLSLISAEQFPLTRADLERAHQHWPALQRWSARLLNQYPEAVTGFHRIQFSDRIDLTLMYGDAECMWKACSSSVDAWFLDGFAPDRNPTLWASPLLQTLAEKSRPGTSLASFSVAGLVRKGLAEAGFELEKKPGFGRKRHRLEGRMPGQHQPRIQRTGHALVAGAGLAGATTARALAERGWQVTVIDRLGIAQGASGNPTGVVYTTPSAHATPQNRFYQSSYLHALRWMQRHAVAAAGIGRFNGVIQHLVSEDKSNKMQAALDSGYWPASLLRSIDDRSVGLIGGGYLQPVRWCEYLLDHPAIELRTANVIDWTRNALLLDDESIEAEQIVLCLAGDTRHMHQLDWLPIRLIRGQVSYCAATPETKHWQQAECHRGYLTPAIDGVHCIGASFNLHDNSPEPSPKDDQGNLEQLKQYRPKRWQALGGDSIQVVDRRVGFRCQSNDYLPIAGAMVDERGEAQAGLWLNLAHGSRGISGTPLCAELLADQISGLPGPMDAAMAHAIAPARFSERQRRRKPKRPVPSR